MNELFDRLTKVPLAHKVLISAMMVAGIAFGYWQVFYSSIQDEFARADVEYKRLADERASYEKRKSEFLAFRQEVQKLREEQKELLKVLPKTSEIPSFLEGIHTQGMLAGLEIQSFRRLDEQPADVYVRIPVAIEAKGNYHQITKFARSVGELKRIVNIENVELMQPAKNDGGLMQLLATFQASTYRFKEPGGPTAAARKR